MAPEENLNPGLQKILTPVVILIFMFALYFFIQGVLPPMTSFNTSAYILAGTLLYLPVITYMKRSTGLPTDFSLNFPSVRFMFFLAVAVITLKIIATPFFYSELHFKALNDGNLMVNSFGLKEPDAGMLLKFIHQVILAPLFEEIFFRGQIQTLMMKRYSPVKAVIFTSFAFAVSHLKPDNLVALFICGLVFGIVYYRTQSLGAAIFLHFSYNLLDFFSVYKSILATDQLFLLNFLAFLLSIVVMSVILMYLGINRKRVEGG